MLKQTYNVNKKLFTCALEHYECIFILSIALEQKLQILNPCSGVEPGEVDWVANHPPPHPFRLTNMFVTKVLFALYFHAMHNVVFYQKIW